MTIPATADSNWSGPTYTLDASVTGQANGVPTTYPFNGPSSSGLWGEDIHSQTGQAITLTGSGTSTLIFKWIPSSSGGASPATLSLQVRFYAGGIAGSGTVYGTGSASDGEGDPYVDDGYGGYSESTRFVQVRTSGGTAKYTSQNMRCSVAASGSPSGRGQALVDAGLQASIATNVPNVAITSPAYNAIFTYGQDVAISAQADLAYGSATLTAITINNETGGGIVGGSAPDDNGDVSVTMTQPSPGPVSVYAEATYSDGTVSDSLPVTFYAQEQTWQATDGSITNNGAITGCQIVAPQDQTQSPAYPANGSLNCAVSAAQDTDYFSLTPVIEGVQDLLNPVDDSGDLSYAWTLTKESPTSGCSIMSPRQNE